MSEQISVTKVSGPDRYQISQGDDVAGFAQYVDADGARVFFHTVIDEAYGGRGLGGKLIAAALDDTRAAGLKASPVCSFVQHYLDKHEEYSDLGVAPTGEHLAAARTIPQL